MRDLNTLKEIFDNYLSGLSFPRQPEGLYFPNTYFLQIGGKRLRPSLLLLACEIYSNRAEDALDAAVAVEFFHNFSLIHDDVMDNASVRRGFKTIHEKFGLNTAILSGDVLLTYAYTYLSKSPQQSLLPVWQVFNRTAIQVCEGQQMDMDYEERESVSEAEYLQMIECKTSVLLAAAMQIGALIGGASQQEAEGLYNYALQLGVAFQIQDDILDCYGSPEIVGKTIGGDIIRNKKTLLNIRAFQAASENNDRSFSKWINMTEEYSVEKVAAVLNIYFKYGVREYAERLRNTKVNNALNILPNLNISEEAKKMLANLGEHLVYRTF